MKRRRLLLAKALTFAAAIGSAIAVGTNAGAQHDPREHQADPQDSQAWLKGDTQKENDAYDLYKQNRLITAGTRADEVLTKNPDSILGNFVRGVVYRQAEGDLQRAMFHLGKARELLERKYDCTRSSSSCPWKFHRDLLFETQLLAGEMEEYEYQLQILDYQDKLYDPVLTAEHAWPLMKLGRFDDARAIAKKAIESKDAQQQVLGKNALCAIEGEARTRKPWFDACVDAYEAAKKAQADLKKTAKKDGEETSITVHAYNAALSAFAVLRFDEVERLAREGTASKALSIANPWRMLTLYYTSGGRVVEALQAVRAMQSWRAHEPASMRDQDQAETDSVLATLLMVAGEPDSAMRLVARAIDRPDRRGLVSSKSDQALGAHVMLRRTLARMAAEQELERASYGSFAERMKALAGATAKRALTWTDDERIASIMTDDERLDSTFRIYLGGGVEVPTWMLGDLVEVLGAGIVSVVLDRVGTEEAGAPELAPYFDAIEAEVLLHQGDYARAIELADRAIKNLPKGDALLAGRAGAVGGEAARRKGDMTAASRLFEVAMQRDAGVVRRLGFALPAVVRASGGDPAVVRAAELLARSPRLRETANAFVVTVSKVGPRLRSCLLSAQGAELSCAETETKEGESSDDFAAHLARDFHREVFTLTFGLSQADLQSLDGSISIASQAQREKMKGMLRDLAGE